MKKTAVLLSLLVMFSFSCDKKYKFYAFYIVKTVNLEFEEGSVSDFETIQDVSVSIENVLESHGTEADLIEEITIEEVSLTYNDYDKFNSFNLFISAEGLTEVPLATNDSISLTFYDKIILNESKEIMDDYVKASTFKVKSTGEISAQQAQAFTVPVDLRFLVKSYVK